jgi:hypothetical protein
MSDIALLAAPTSGFWMALPLCVRIIIACVAGSRSAIFASTRSA